MYRKNTNIFAQLQKLLNDFGLLYKMLPSGTSQTSTQMMTGITGTTAGTTLATGMMMDMVHIHYNIHQIPLRRNINLIFHFCKFDFFQDVHMSVIILSLFQTIQATTTGETCTMTTGMTMMTGISTTGTSTTTTQIGTMMEIMTTTSRKFPDNRIDLMTFITLR